MKIHPSTSPIQPIVYAQNFDVCGLSCTTATTLPVGFQVRKLDGNGSTVASWSFTGSGWEDDATGSPVTSTAINGLVSFYNPAAYDIGIGITW